MPTTATSGYVLVANTLKEIIDAEFTDLNLKAVHDDLHESLGTDRRECGISPIDEPVMTGNGLVQEIWVEVKFYDYWKREISPKTAVDPRVITNYAERFRRAIRSHRANDPATGQLWYYDLRRIQYPKDPTGNKSRFIATIRGYGNNAQLVETTG